MFSHRCFSGYIHTYVHIHIYVCICVYAHTYLYAYFHMYTYEHMYTCMYVCGARRRLRPDARRRESGATARLRHRLSLAQKYTCIRVHVYIHVGMNPHTHSVCYVYSSTQVNVFVYTLTHVLFFMHVHTWCMRVWETGSVCVCVCGVCVRERQGMCVCVCAGMNDSKWATQRGTFSVIFCSNYTLLIHTRPFVSSSCTYLEPLLDSKDNTVTEHMYFNICNTTMIECARCYHVPHSLRLFGRTRNNSRFLSLPLHVFLTAVSVPTSLSRSFSLRTQTITHVYMPTCIYMYIYDTCTSLLRSSCCRVKLVQSTTSVCSGTHYPWLSQCTQPAPSP